MGRLQSFWKTVPLRSPRLTALAVVLLLLPAGTGSFGGTGAHEAFPPPGRAADGGWETHEGAHPLLDWLREVGDLLDERIGPTPSFPEEARLRIRLLPADSEEPESIESRQHWQHGIPHSQLVLRHPEVLDQEALLEAFCGLWLQRLLWGLSPPRDPWDRPPPPPPWLVQGVARSLYPAQMARNRIVWEQAADTGDPSAEELLRMKDQAPGRTPQAVLAGLFWEWVLLRSTPRGPGPLLRRLAEDGAVEAATLAEMLDFSSAGDLAQDWEVWLFSRRRLIGDHRFRAPDSLLSMQDDPERVPSELMSLARRMVIEEDGTLDRLLQQREEAWIGPLCQAMIWRLRVAGLGQPPALAEMYERYARFFEALEKPPPLTSRARRREMETLQALRREARAAREALIAAGRSRPAQP